MSPFHYNQNEDIYKDLIIRFPKNGFIDDNGLIEYDDEFIDRITVYRDKEEKSDVDERETARYSSAIKSEEVSSKYEYMTDVCKKAISQCEEIVFSGKEFEIPKELYE